VSERRRGLGRGLGALIPAAPTEKTPAQTAVGGAAVPSPAAAPVLTTDRGVAAAKVTTLPAVSHETEEPSVFGDGGGGAETPAPPIGAHFAEIPLDDIAPNPRQPREVFDEDALQELVTSIQEVGLLQPVVVRQLGPSRYELIMGERRWRACQLAGVDVIPAIVKQTSDDELLRNALIENLHREQLNPLEEAAAYQQLLDDFSATHDELAKRVGRSRPHISNTIRLLSLPPAVQKRVAAGVLSAGHARALLSVEDPVAQEELAHRIVAEGLSVRAVEEIVAVGARPAKSPRQPGAKQPVAPALRELADQLSDALETRVKVEIGQRKGKIVVEFATVDDLERIVRTISPGLSLARRG
jgi:ParB family transcriptional regulator, chromosome partitioning protein